MNQTREELEGIGDAMTDIFIGLMLILMCAVWYEALLAWASRRQNTDKAIECAKHLAQEHKKANVERNPYIGPTDFRRRSQSKAWIAYEDEYRRN